MKVRIRYAYFVVSVVPERAESVPALLLKELPGFVNFDSTKNLAVFDASKVSFVDAARSITEALET